MRIANAPAAAMSAIAVVNAPPPPGLEFSTGFAGAFVGGSVIFGGTMFVGLANTAGGGGFDAVVIGGGLVGVGLNLVRESRLVPTFVPTITSGAMTIGRCGGLVLTGAAG